MIVKDWIATSESGWQVDLTRVLGLFLQPMTMCAIPMLICEMTLYWVARDSGFNVSGWTHVGIHGALAGIIIGLGMSVIVLRKGWRHRGEPNYHLFTKAANKPPH